MNENKIAFIICYNDELCMSECVRYINRLNVPVGIERDIIGIQGAESMCAGYNAAMRDSDAKYKVYMHQDVFILNLNFIEDVIKIFRDNPQYGMLGVCGSDKVLADASYWLEWNTGATRWGGNINEDVRYNFGRNESCLMPVVALDGMMMITQYDLPWREDLFDAFDFYDVSQSFEFTRAGYRVGVVPQTSPWCLHDCGWSNMSRYDRYRQIFCREYSGYGHKYEENPQNIRQREVMGELDKRNDELAVLLERGRDGDKNALSVMADFVNEHHLINRTLATNIVILETIYSELLGGSCEFLEGGRVHSAAEMTNQFTRYKYFLRRVELGFPLEDDEVYREVAARKDKRLLDLRAIAPHVTLEPEAAMKRLAEALGV
jgi:hypothetical protein